MRVESFSSMAIKKQVIIVGGGFAGLQLARRLDASLFDVLLIDKLNYHQFQPLFYQVATAQLEPSSISFPLRNIFNHAVNVQIRMAEVSEVETANNTIQTSIGSFTYDYLVLAMGCQTNFFGNTEIPAYAFTLKSTAEAISVRNHILEVFEKLVSATETDKESLKNLVIVGAGPTGVELAGAFAEIKKNILPKDYHGIDLTSFQITLVEGSKETLNNMSLFSKKHSRKYLEEMGVKILSETFVKHYDGRLLTLSTGQTMQSNTVIWAAGVTGNVIGGLEKQLIPNSNRVKVNRANRVDRTDNVFAIGDIACMETPLYPKGHPQVANVAISQAKLLAGNLKRSLAGKSMLDFEYKDLGSMATIGRNKAVVDFPFMHVKGYVAWLIWMFLHLMLILRVKNKLIIFINWAWAYFTKDTSLRLIFTQDYVKK
jgi:NADH dehydrogenase